MIPELFEVTEKTQETSETFTLAARPLQGTDLSFQPGQFNMLYVAGKGEIPISISGSPRETHQLVHTVQCVGPISNAFCKLKVGESFGVRGPFGRGWPIEQAQGGDVILMAGGLGLAPLRPVIHEIAANREKYGTVVILYGARSLGQLLFEKELREWRRRFNFEILVTLDLAAPAWHGRVGVVTSLCRLAAQIVDMKDTVSFVCGPHIMMRFSVRELLKHGAREEAIFISTERNLKCALGHCGHCQFGPYFLCKDGPVFSYSKLSTWLEVREL